MSSHEPNMLDPKQDSIDSTLNFLNPREGANFSSHNSVFESGEAPSNELMKRARKICEKFSRNHYGNTMGKYFPHFSLARSSLLREKRSQLKARLDERIWAAACWRDFHLSCVQKAFDAEVAQIEKEYEAERSQLKDKLLTDLLEYRRRLTENKGLLVSEEQQDSNGSNNNPTSNNKTSIHRKLRGKRGTEVETSKNLQTTSKRKQQLMGLEGLGVNLSIPESDVYEDLVIILKEEGGTKRLTRQSNNSKSQPIASEDDQSLGEVFAKGDTIHCFGKTFERGDFISVKSPDSSEWTGEIIGVGTKDLWINIEDDAKLKITFQQIRAGRYIISLVDQEEDSS